MKLICKSYYPRLLRRNHNFYIRVAIPRYLWYLARRKEIKYSLKTSNYQDALFKMRIETIKADFFIEFLKGLDMRKRNGALILEDADIEKFILYRLKEIDEFCDRNRVALQRKTKSFEDVGLFTQKNLQNWIDEDPDSKMDEVDNRKRLYNSYENVKKFFMLFWQNGRIDEEAFNLISDAYLNGRLFLPDGILKEIEEYAEAAKKSYVLENRLKRQHDEKEIIKLNKEIVEINSIFYNADPASIYRNFLCIK